MRTLFENDKIKVFMNPSDEVFIERKSNSPTYNNVTLRISDSTFAGLELTADNAIFQPTSFNGLGGFRITNPRSI